LSQRGATPIAAAPPALPPLPAELARRGIALRPIRPEDQPTLRALYGQFRAEEMAFAPWSAAQKAAFLDDQFRLQHHHFATHHPHADFWLIERAAPPSAPVVVGRLYLDRTTPTWRVLDVGLATSERGRGTGSALLIWIQNSASAAGGVDLHVVLTNMRARSLYERLGFTADGAPVGHHQRMVWRPDPALRGVS
jgi:ribosomal protein S18 acetylase RimI-like enzyme